METSLTFQQQSLDCIQLHLSREFKWFSGLRAPILLLEQFTEDATLVTSSVYVKVTTCDLKSNFVGQPSAFPSHHISAFKIEKIIF